MSLGHCFQLPSAFTWDLNSKDSRIKVKVCCMFVVKVNLTVQLTLLFWRPSTEVSCMFSFFVECICVTLSLFHDACQAMLENVISRVTVIFGKI